jgi:hypothetical protein
MRYFALLAAGLVALAARPSVGQVGWGHEYDAQGIRKLSLEFRNGAFATRHRVGNVEFYKSSNGTTGISWYGATGRFDSFSNRKRDWSASRYVPYGRIIPTYGRWPGSPPPVARGYELPDYDTRGYGHRTFYGPANRRLPLQGPFDR